MEQFINMNGKTYNRQISMLGDVEKITWFQCLDKETEKEIYDQDEMLELEGAYEKIICRLLTPILPII